MAKIFQIYYSHAQKKYIAHPFIPYDNTANLKPDEHEFFVFRKEYLSKIALGEAYGFVSWKFRQKTGVTPEKFQRFCEENDDYDVCFINPFPGEIINGNVWENGEMWTPGITKLTQSLFDECGYLIDLNSIPQRLSLLSFCNYWVGTPQFWRAYMNFCNPLYEYIAANQGNSICDKILQIADTSRNASHFSFIFERLFSTFIANNTCIKHLSYQYNYSDLCARYSVKHAQFIMNLQVAELNLPKAKNSIATCAEARIFRDQHNKLINSKRTNSSKFIFQIFLYFSSRLERFFPANKVYSRLQLELSYCLNPGMVYWRKDQHNIGTSGT